MTNPTPIHGFDGLIGFTMSEVSPDRFVGELTITPNLHQPYGIVHGGVYCAIIETAASWAGSTWLGDKGQCVGVNNNTNFLRATREGKLTVTAAPIHRGRTQQLWQVEVIREDGKAAATGQVRLANIENPAQIGG